MKVNEYGREEIEGLPKDTYHYLGTIKHEGEYYDLGVHAGFGEVPTEPSDATVYGKEDWEYNSGDLAYSQHNPVRKETVRRWKKYLKLIGGEG